MTVIANLSNLDPDDFWTVMDNRSWMHPFDANGERAALQRHSQIVCPTWSTIRSARWPGELRRAGGFAKDTTPFQRISLGGFPAPPHEAQKGRT